MPAGQSWWETSRWAGGRTEAAVVWVEYKLPCAWSVRLVMHMVEGVVAGMVRHTYTRTLTAERESAAAAKDTVSSVAVDSIVT